MQVPIKVSATPMLRFGDEIPLRLNEEIDVKKAKPGDPVHFALYHDFWYRDTLLARAGAPVEAVVQDAEKAGMASKRSKLVIVPKTLTLLNGQVIPLLGRNVFRGPKGAGQETAESLNGINTPGPNCFPYCAPVGLLLLLAPGGNGTLKVDTTGFAYVRDDIDLDLASFAAFQPESGQPTGKVRVLRGYKGSLLGRDLYCNGVPLARLHHKRTLELNLKPGYYRFAVKPKKGEVLEIYVAPGSETNLLCDSDRIWVMNEKEANINTMGVHFSPFAKKKSGEDLLKDSKPLDASEIYTTACTPLKEESETPAATSAPAEKDKK